MHNRKEKAHKKFMAVKRAIDVWNPYALLPLAPEDEFDGESRMVTGRIKGDEDVAAIAEIVSDVFSKQFEKEDFPISHCIDVAEAIRLNLLGLPDKTR